LVRKPGLSLSELFDLDLFKGLFKLHVFESISTYVKKYFKHPQLVQLLEFPVLFLGATPEHTPALYSLMNYADLFIVNQEEAAVITGVPYQKKRQIFKKLDELVHGRVIMTKGSRGVEVSDGKTLWSAGVLPLDKSEIVDRTGAGDAFGSGFVAALMRKPNNIEYAIQFASANATGVLTEWGANHGLLKRGDSPNKYGVLQIKAQAL